MEKKIQMILSQLIEIGIEDARETLQVLEDFRLFSKFGELMLKSLKQLNRSLDREEFSHKKQIVITSCFFSKQQI